MDDRRRSLPAPASTNSTSAPRHRMTRRAAVLSGLVGSAVAACSNSSDPEPSTPAAAPTEEVRTVATTTPPPPSAAAEAPSSDPDSPLADWSLEQKVGQLLMVGADAAQPQNASRDAVTTHHVGNVFISGRSTDGSAAVRGTVSSLTGLVGPESTHDVALLVATDQEGGQVQVLSGSGFSSIPSALDQAAMGHDDLRASARTWGQELADAGITMNLAPVADLVDVPGPSTNGPIGKWSREYGHDGNTVLDRASAFAEGMQDAGVIATYKHFPGLGRVTGNTDTVANVTDTTTSRSDDAAVAAFAGAIGAGAQVVMISSAVYTLIDGSAPAMFSSVVTTDMLRGDLGFTGVAITDDVSTAAQVQDWTPGNRAVEAVRAGCDIVLASADPTVVGEMAGALVAAAQADPAMAARVDESVLRVLTLKGVQ